MDPTKIEAAEQKSELPENITAFRDEAPATDQPDPAERDREAAFAAQHQWDGKTLHPLSISRMSCWLQHRFSMGAPELADCLRDLDAFLADACRLLWLCSVEPAVFTAARQNPARMQALIDEWSDAHIRPGQQAEAVLTAFRVYSAAIANRHIPAPSQNKNPEDSGN
jgi:hypothetical protein